MRNTQSTGGRFLAAALAALIFSSLVFLGLYGLISRHGGNINKADLLPTIDFVRLKRTEELQTLDRHKPPPPPPPKTPPPPQKLKVSTDTPQETPLQMSMPNLGLSASIGGGPFLGAMGSGAPAAGPGMSLFEGDVIPLQRIAPVYPRKASMDGTEGYVKVQLIIKTDGSVRDAQVIESKPRGVFDAAAIASVMKWKFKPKVLDGQPVEQKGSVKIDFNLGDE